jgi:phospholipid/cholesterol/gamma-HCH transport system ATP-binding protein
MSDENPILSFREVTIEAGPDRGAAVRNASFDLLPGDLMLVRLGEGRLRIPLADAAAGLTAPGGGTVSFCCEDWAGMHPDRAAACRSRIGRVFDEQEWISNLDVDENVTLAQRHHTKKIGEEIAGEAGRLAQAFGLPELPQARCPFVEPENLRRASWVRAFLGDPLLLLLERPERDATAEMLSPLFEAVRAALERGAAALVTTGREALWHGSGLEPRLECSLRGPELVIHSEAVK